MAVQVAERAQIHQDVQVHGISHAVKAQQFVMPSRFGHAPIFNHVDAVRMRNRVQTVRNDKSGAALAEMFHGLAHL